MSGRLGWRAPSSAYTTESSRNPVRQQAGLRAESETQSDCFWPGVVHPGMLTCRSPPPPAGFSKSLMTLTSSQPSMGFEMCA